MKSRHWIVGALALAMFSCGDNPPELPEFTIPFVANVNGVAVECGQIYEGLGSSASSIDLRDVRFYIHDVQLLTQDGTAVDLLLNSEGHLERGCRRRQRSTSKRSRDLPSARSRGEASPRGCSHRE